MSACNFLDYQERLEKYTDDIIRVTSMPPASMDERFSEALKKITSIDPRDLMRYIELVRLCDFVPFPEDRDYEFDDFTGLVGLIVMLDIEGICQSPETAQSFVHMLRMSVECAWKQPIFADSEEEEDGEEYYDDISDAFE